MGLRENFKQAAKELMDGPESTRTRGYEPLPETVPARAAEPEPIRAYAPPGFGQGRAAEPARPYGAEPGQARAAEPSRPYGFPSEFGEGRGAEPMRAYAAPEPTEAREDAKELTTVIAAGTVVRGSIKSECNVEVYGEVQGDVITTKDLKLKGRIRGNAAGGNVELCGIHMVGNIMANGTATLDTASEVEGDVTAKTVILNGKVWGNVQVSKLLAMENNAVICGRVSAEKLSVDEGAVIQGEIIIGKNMTPPRTAAPAARPAAPKAAPAARPAARPAAPAAKPAEPKPAPAAKPAEPKPAPAAKPAEPKPEKPAGEAGSEG